MRALRASATLVQGKTTFQLLPLVVLRALTPSHGQGFSLGCELGQVFAFQALQSNAKMSHELCLELLCFFPCWWQMSGVPTLTPLWGCSLSAPPDVSTLNHQLVLQKQKLRLICKRRSEQGQCLGGETLRRCRGETAALSENQLVQPGLGQPRSALPWAAAGLDPLCSSSSPHWEAELGGSWS